MKNKVTQLFLLLGLAIGTAGFAQAQVSTPQKMNVPFDFVAGEKSFKAGDYLISHSVTSRNIIFIRSVDGKNMTTIFGTLKESVGYTGDNKFVFDRQDDKYILTQINTPQTSVELHSFKSKAQAAKNSKSKNVL